MTIENKNNLYEIIDEKWTSNSFRSYWSYDDCKECLIRCNGIKCPINTKVFYYNEKLAYFLLSKEKLKMMRLDSNNHGKIEYQNGLFFKKYYNSSFIEGLEFLKNNYGGKDYIKELNYVKTLYNIFIEAKQNLNDFNLNIESAHINISSTNYFSINIMERYGFCSGIIHYYTEIRKRYKDIFLKIESEAVSKIKSKEYIQNIKNNKDLNNIITDVFDKNDFISKYLIDNANIDPSQLNVSNFNTDSIIIAYTLMKMQVNTTNCVDIINTHKKVKVKSKNLASQGNYNVYENLVKISPKDRKTKTLARNEAENIYSAMLLIDLICKNPKKYLCKRFDSNFKSLYKAKQRSIIVYENYKKEYEEIFKEKLDFR